MEQEGEEGGRVVIWKCIPLHNVLLHRRQAGTREEVCVCMCVWSPAFQILSLAHIDVTARLLFSPSGQTSSSCVCVREREEGVM